MKIGDMVIVYDDPYSDRHREGVALLVVDHGMQFWGILLNGETKTIHEDFLRKLYDTQNTSW